MIFPHVFWHWYRLLDRLFPGAAVKNVVSCVLCFAKDLFLDKMPLKRLRKFPSGRVDVRIEVKILALQKGGGLTMPRYFSGLTVCPKITKPAITVRGKAL